MKRTLCRVVAVGLLLAGAGSGCGYHLRGTAALPKQLSSVYVQAVTPEFRDELALVLTDSGARVTERREEAEATLLVGSEIFDERVLSVDPETGKAREFELAYSLTFVVSARDGRILLPSQSLSLLRDYVFDKDAVIGKSREKVVLQTEMRRDAVLQILRRLQIALAN